MSAKTSYANARHSYRIGSAGAALFEELHKLYAESEATRVEWKTSEEHSTIVEQVEQCQAPSEAGSDGVGCAEGGSALQAAVRGMRNVARVDDLESMIRRITERVVRQTANSRLVEKQELWVSRMQADLDQVLENQATLEERLTTSQDAEAAAAEVEAANGEPSEVQMALGADTRLAARRVKAHSETVEEIKEQMDAAQAGLMKAKRARAAQLLAVEESRIASVEMKKLAAQIAQEVNPTKREALDAKREVFRAKVARAWDTVPDIFSEKLPEEQQAKLDSQMAQADIEAQALYQSEIDKMLSEQQAEGTSPFRQKQLLGRIAQAKANMRAARKLAAEKSRDVGERLVRKELQQAVKTFRKQARADEGNVEVEQRFYPRCDPVA